MSFKILVRSLALATASVAGSLSAAVLLTDGFATGPDGSKYALQISTNSSVSGGDMLQSASGAELAGELPSVGVLPDDIIVETIIKINDPTGADRLNTGVPEANCGFRVHEQGPSLTGEIFTYLEKFGGDPNPDQDVLVIRRSQLWDNRQISNITTPLTANQRVLLRETITAAGNITCELLDPTTLSALCTPLNSTRTAMGITQTTGPLRITQWNHATPVRYESVTVKKISDSSVILTDDFAAASIDGTKWHGPGITQANNVGVDGNYLNMFSGAGLANLPTKGSFGNIDLQAVFRLTDVNAGGDFSIQFRQSSLTNLYQFVFHPQSGGTVNGVATPCLSLRKPDGVGGFVYLAGPTTVAQPASGSTFVMNIRANGSSIKCYSGPSTTQSSAPILQITDASFASGIVNFTSFFLPAVDMDTFTIWDAGTGTLPPTDTAADSDWMLL